MPDFSIIEWFKALGPFQSILLALSFAPAVVSRSIPSELTGYLNPTYVSLGISFIGFFSSRNNFSGPLRYGITKYGPEVRSLYGKSPDGTIWVLLLLRTILPWTQAWLVSVLAISWQYTLQHFREDVRDVVETANNICARTTIAVTTAKEDVEAASRYERDALSSSDQALRDARLAKGIKASDFFNAATDAWAAIETAAESINGAQNYSNTASTAAESARTNATSYSSTATAATNYANFTRTATNNAAEASNRVRASINVITNFRAARDQDSTAREEATEHAETAKKAVRDLLEQTVELPDDLNTLMKDAQEVRYKVSQAVAKAEQGRMDRAKELSDEALEELGKLEEEATRISGVKDSVRELFSQQILGSE